MSEASDISYPDYLMVAKLLLAWKRATPGHTLEEELAEAREIFKNLEIWNPDDGA